MNDELKIKNNELGGKMNYRYRTDEEMKDSGVEWLGSIPKSWDIRQLKRVLIDRKENNSPIKTNNILSLTMEKGVIPYSEKGSGGNKAKEDLSLYKLVYPNDIVLNSMNVVVGSVGLSKYFGCASPAYYMLYKKNGSDSIEYYNNIFQSKLFQDSLIGLGNGILVKKSETSGKLNTIRMRIPMEKLNLVKIPIPKSSEQEKIAKFLDEKTAQFDSIISKKEALIEKLEEAKKSLISEVVTGKVRVVKTNDGYELVERKKEEMKDSGVEWLGDIPKEWDLKRSNYVFKFSKGLSITKENLKDEGIPCINYGEIHSKYGFEVNPKRHKLKCVTEEYFNSNPNALIKYGHFVFADTSEDIQGCGNFSYLNAEDSIFAGYHTIIVRPIKTVSSRYLAYLFDSDDWRIQIRTKVSGIKVFSITQSILKTTKVILPTLSEQKLIVDYLDNKFVNINSMINNMKKQIEKLKEAKQSLISEAVTGKIEILD